jgi:hypothetical protein
MYNDFTSKQPDIRIGGVMGIIGSVFTEGVWHDLDDQGTWDGTNNIEKVRLQLVDSPVNSGILYQVEYWDTNARKWMWTAPRADGVEVGIDGHEIYGLHIMLTNFAGVTVWIALKTSNGWGAAHSSQAESFNPIFGLSLLIAQP